MNLQIYGGLTFHFFTWAGLLMAVGVGFVLFHPEERRKGLIFLLSWLFAFLVLVFNLGGIYRYFLPALAFAAPLSVFWLRRVAPMKYVLPFLFLLGLWQLSGWAVVRRFPALPRAFYHEMQLQEKGFTLSPLLAPAPILTPYPLEEAVGVLSRMSYDDVEERRRHGAALGREERYAWVIMLSDSYLSLGDNVSYYRMLNRAPFRELMTGWNAEMDEDPSRLEKELERRSPDAFRLSPDYLVVLDDGLRPERTRAMRAFIASRRLIPVAEYRMPVRGTLLIFRFPPSRKGKGSGL